MNAFDVARPKLGTLPESEAAASARSPASTNGSSVELFNVVKKFGDFAAVDGVSLTIEPGAFVTLLGASGSGKTTLLRIIAGFAEATSGQVLIDSLDVAKIPVHKRGIGMVFQNYALFPHLNVAKNVEFPLSRHKVPKAARAAKIEEALAAVRLTGLEKRLPRELSGGQQQRVALARAIVLRPRLLLMDEPLGALDRNLRESLQIEIRRLSRDLGLTVVNVTHDQEEALTMSDKIALLAAGKLVQFGSPEDLYVRPADRLVAEFIGESNIFEGTLRTDQGRVVLDSPQGLLVVPASAHALNGQATMVVRPTAAVIRPAGALKSAPANRVSGTVRAVIFAGESRKVVLLDGTGEERVVRMHASETFDFAPGDDVFLEWDHAASRVLSAQLGVSNEPTETSETSENELTRSKL
ncbi:MAG: ABC transporter ATP-binding protein [Bifidobacteriaceae bacterium]|jgi:putative spermidine/putrescine transport system ATP-binding protein|nr:ABC transporter ATP-binding protein [Bifidobacteriaceae bacterium]